MAYNVLVMGSGGNAARNYVSSLKMSSKVGVIVGIDTDPNSDYFHNCDLNYVISKNTDLLETLHELIAKHRIDYIHAQPEYYVRFLAEHKDQFSIAGSFHDLEFYDKFADKKYCQEVWNQELGLGFEVHSLEECELKPILFHRLLERTGKVWMRARTGAGSRAALPISKLEHGKFWAEYWRSKNEGVDDFVLSEYLPGNEYAVQMIWIDGQLKHLQARERLEYFFARQMPSGQSSTPSVAKVVNIPEVSSLAVACVKAIHEKPHGIYCADMKRNWNNVIVPTEVNYGRFFTTSYFFSKLGLNSPLDFMLHQLGEPMERKIDYLPENSYAYRGLDMPMKIIQKREQ
jgi:hypothetical protein